MASPASAFDMIIDRVRETIAEYGMLTRGDRVVVGVSGGPDSMVLLDVLDRLRPEFDLDLIVAHLNHGTRGPESDEDEAFVRRISAERGLRCRAARAEVEAMATARGQSLEEVGRSERYRLFRTLKVEFQATRIATGHTMNDQAETFLLNLLRGAGPRGLSAIPPATSAGVIRPLIRIRRAEVEEYLRERGIEARIDHTNVAPDFTRNRIREGVLPVLEREVNPSVVEVLARDAEIFSEIDHRLTTEARQHLEVLAEISPSEVQLDVAGFPEMDRVLMRAILREAILRVKGDLRNVTHQHVDALLHLCLDGQSGRSIDLPGGTTAERVFDHLHLKRGPRPGSSDDEVANVEVEIDPGSPEEIQWNRYLLSPQVLEPVPPELDVEGTDVRNPEWDPTGVREAYFDLDELRPPIRVRSARPGDRLVPFGMDGHKKVFDLLMESRVPRGARVRVPVVEDAEGILWVVGVRRGSRAPLAATTRRALKLAARETDRGGEGRGGGRHRDGGRREGGRREGGRPAAGRRRH